METTIIKVGNSKGLIIPKRVLNRFGDVDTVDLQFADGKITLVPLESNHSRKNWEKQFAVAIHAGHEPDNDFFENIENGFDKEDWTW